MTREPKQRGQRCTAIANGGFHMARLATTITTTFAPTTAELLRQFAQYVDEIDHLHLRGVEFIELVAGPHPDIFAGALSANALH